MTAKIHARIAVGVLWLLWFPVVVVFGPAMRPGTESMPAYVAVAVGLYWLFSDAHDRGVTISSIAKVLSVLVLPLGVGTYVVQTRGWKGLAKFFGNCVLLFVVLVVLLTPFEYAKRRGYLGPTKNGPAQQVGATIAPRR